MKEYLPHCISWGVWQSFRYAARLNCKLVGIILSICARLLCVCVWFVAKEIYWVWLL